MKKLKTRLRADTLPSEPRRASVKRRWDSTIYIVILLALFLAVGNHLLGDRVFMRADGLVMQERSMVAAATTVQATEIKVQPGESVQRGQLLLRAESIDTVARLAELTLREAEMAERSARLRADLVVARRLAPKAEERVAELSQRRSEMDQLDRSRLITTQNLDALREDFHQADSRAVSLAAQVEGLSAEIVALDHSRAEVRAAIQELERRYNGGLHHAAQDGIIGPSVPVQGEVLAAGAPLLTVYSGQPYVLAYLPRAYLFSIRNGMEVSVASGQWVRKGRISEILPISTPLPDEFRNTFRQRESRQLARITLDDGPALPILSTVEIRRDWPHPIAWLLASAGHAFAKLRTAGDASEVKRPES